jgi:signal transduction histidine kinase
MPQESLLGGLLGHLSSCHGLYAKETFESLYSCITRLLRDHRMRGLVFSQTLGDVSFEAMALALSSLPEITFHAFEPPPPEEADHHHRLGFLCVLTDRLCAVVYWSDQTSDTFKLYQGGWTFHPGDAKTITTQLMRTLVEEPEQTTWLERIALTETERRYDDKINLLVTSLVNGLEHRNRELTQALNRIGELHRKMLDSERLAAVGQLCSVIAHEIRNPLGLIDLYVKLIETQLGQAQFADAQAAEALHKNLHLVRQATQSLEVILSELTDYSRPLTLHLAPCPLLAWIQDVCDFMRPSFTQRGIVLEVHTSGEVDSLQKSVDAQRLRQALINLLKNALEVNQEAGTVTVTLARRRADEALYIKVCDQGPGVPAEIVPKLFTPYFSTKGNGTGLGLAHSQKILQAHGGSVALISNGPQGATFALILPA